MIVWRHCLEFRTATENEITEVPRAYESSPGSFRGIIQGMMPASRNELRVQRRLPGDETCLSWSLMCLE